MGARKTLGFSPLVEAGGAHSSRAERVPLMAAATRPAVVLAGRPATEGAPDARAGRVEALLLVKLAIQNDGGFREFIRQGTHAPLL